jgi:archaellum component FlaG (FlaF/FlaG flagellin family)
MKLLNIIILILLSSFNNDTGPIITLNKEIHNYGIIEYNSNGNCQFIIKNTGAETLTINNIKTSCGCTITDIQQKDIKAGDSSQLTIRYDTKRPGAINKKIIIYSNDIKTPEKEIFIKGYVKSIN